MNGNSQQIIVESGHPQTHSSSAVAVHHREFPEIRGEGFSALEAAGHLLQRLEIALDGTPNHWHRDGLRQAIADIQDFLDRGAPASADLRPSAPVGDGQGKPLEPT